MQSLNDGNTLRPCGIVDGRRVKRERVVRMNQLRTFLTKERSHLTICVPIPNCSHRGFQRTCADRGVVNFVPENAMSAQGKRLDLRLKRPIFATRLLVVVVDKKKVHK